MKSPLMNRMIAISKEEERGKRKLLLLDIIGFALSVSLCYILTVIFLCL